MRGQTCLHNKRFDVELTTATFQNGTGFKFDTNSVLTLSQSMICDSLWPGCVFILSFYRFHSNSVFAELRFGL
jgi:hypothetical protein